MTGRRSPKARAAPSARAAAKGTDGVEQLLQKTKWCRFFFEGKCQRGGSCTFAHSASELHAQPDLYRSQLCVEFSETGKCRYGSNCRFAHGESQLRQVASPEQCPDDRRAVEEQLEEMRQKTRALEARLEAALPASEAWHYDGMWGCWPCQDAEYMAGVDCQSWEDAAWASYGGCSTITAGEVFVPASRVAVFLPPAPWQPDCAASQVSTDWEGHSGSSQHADSDGEDPASPRGGDSPRGAGEDAGAGPRVVVRNTFIEFEAPANAPARRRARSAPCGRSAAEGE